MWVQKLFSKVNLSEDINEHLSEQSIHYMLNGDLISTGSNKSKLFVQNQLSNELCFDFDNKELCGYVKLDKNQYVLFFAPGEIGIFDSNNCSYNLWVSSPCLKLNVNNWVTGVYKYIKDKRYVYFVDGNNPIRYINIDDEYPKTYSNCRTCNDVVINELDCDRIKLNKNIHIPKIKLIETDGELPNGNYQVAIRFTDNQIGLSEYYIYPQVLKFHSNNGNKRFGIKIEFECFNTDYEQYELVLISSRADRAGLGQTIGYYDIGVRHITISQLDSNRYKPIDYSTLFETKPYYLSAEHISSNAERLILGKVKTRSPLNYQPQAFSIRSKWISVKVKKKDAYKFPSYMRDEVYAHEIRWIYKDGERSSHFHIPPHDLDLGVSVGTINTNDTWEDCNGNRKYWEIYNTAIANNNSYTNNDDPVVTQYGICYKYTITNLPDCYVLDVNVNDGDLQLNKPFNVTYKTCDDKIVTVTKTRDSPGSGTLLGLIIGKEIISIEDTQTAVVLPDNQWSLLSKTPVYNDFTIKYKDCENNNKEVNIKANTNEPTSYTFCGLEEQFEVIGTSYETIVKSCKNQTGLGGDSTDAQCENYIPIQEGKFAYWESTLLYPDEDIYGDKRCKPIKYHKFPDSSISPHYSKDGDCTDYEEYANILTIQFDNIEFPKDCNGKTIEDILGYEILVRDRKGNQSILHKGLLYNMREEPLPDCSTGLYSNYPFNDITEDDYIGSELIRQPNSIRDVVNKHRGTEPKPLTGIRHDAFSYISPDINYVKNDTGSELFIYNEVIGQIQGSFQETDETPKFSWYSALFYYIVATTVSLAGVSGLFSGIGENYIRGILELLYSSFNFLKSFVKPIQHGANQYIESNYNSIALGNATSGNRRRKIDISQYLIPTKLNVNGYKINNYQRESSLFLKLNNTLYPTLNEDISRFIPSDIGCQYEFDCETNVKGKTLKSVSYYGAVKTYNPNQYGGVYDGLVKQITSVYNTPSTGIIFGGDVFITKHKQLRKIPFFKQIPQGLKDEEPFELSDKFNVGVPRYWVDYGPKNELLETVKGINGIGTLINAISSISKGDNKNNSYHFDRTTVFRNVPCDDDDAVSCMRNEFIDTRGKDVSAIITNLILNTSRNALQVQGHFYTHIVATIEYWCESEFIGDFREINEIPYSDVNRDKLSLIKYDTIRNPELFLYDLSMLNFNITKPTSASRTLKCKPNTLDEFKVPFSLKDDIESGVDNWRIFKPLNYHQFTPTDGKFTTIHSIDNYNLMFVFENAIYVTQSDDGLITNNGSNAYLGSGSIFERRMKRLSDEATGYCGSIDKYSFANSRYGTMWIDRLRKRVFLYNGKLDDITNDMEGWFNRYLLTKEVNTFKDSAKIIFDNFTKNYYVTGDEFTISYKPELQSWISFHSFVPDVYLQLPNNYMTIKNNSIWKHNKLYDYQSYYNTFYKFDVGYTITNKFSKINLASLQVYAEFIKEEDYLTKYYESNLFFDKFCAYNSHCSTGIKDLQFKNPSTHFQQLKNNESEVTEIDSHIYRINDFKNIGKGPLLYWYSSPMRYELVNTDNNLNPLERGNIQGKYINLHFINSIHNKKIFMQLALHQIEDVKQ